MATLKDFRDERLRKLTELQGLGVNPYPADVSRSHKNQAITTDFSTLEGKTVTVVGRVQSIRKFGKIAFIVLKDESGQVQLFWKSGKESADYSRSELLIGNISLLDTGDFLECTGIVIKTQTGEVSVEASSVRLLTKSLRPMPSQNEGFTDQETRYRQRYVDLQVNPSVKEEIIIRSKVTETIRQFLIEKDFIELETPVLQPLYGGASARPFITYHHKLESDLYLRISNELYLKRAIVAGFERVFEFSRDFRNEGIDRSHNPEFTMLEFYWAYADYNNLMTLTEEMIQRVLTTVKGNTTVSYQGHELDFSAPFKRYTFREIILEKTGVDIDSVSNEELLSELRNRKIDVDEKAPRKELLDEFYKETCRKQIVQPIFLLDYPSEMIPLAKKKPENPKYIASVQLVCCGFELLKAYNELNDPIDQLERLTVDQVALEEGVSEEAMNIDIDFIRALEYGMPPTAGWGLGIDRFVSFLVDRPAIKDVILFPTLRPEDYTDEIKEFYPHIRLEDSSAKFKRTE
jgi:lysyl-tRNA synthetase class 2